MAKIAKVTKKEVEADLVELKRLAKAGALEGEKLLKQAFAKYQTLDKKTKAELNKKIALAGVGLIGLMGLKKALKAKK